ncbi:DUF1127 domain-containing protein [Litoreibacter janthinus]|uniref:Uncharacterized conserved protein YjiS, DUF1127 family n=1 Tax=Litoreibacter janthinus TaxID=670154 RepID=A0A1I6HTS6_9RHOB|nr:DUF1127 domain-containing protein [Litoreibacter janthinus]SFR57797.1 Uncharacterized conserved protein YjiS, DUF1127 family [Litoreibacter janthinus]
MAVFETSRSLNEGVRADARGVFASLIGAVVAWNDRRVTRNALSCLTSRELDDIGLSRGDIYNV